MFKRACLAAALFTASFSATAQSTFESSGLGDIDPWGIGTLSRSEGALPNTLWANTDTATLNNLFARTSVRSLSPVGRDLVARAMLSSARRPQGENGDGLLLRRLDLIKDLGNPELYANFIRQAANVEGVTSPFELSIDQQFARGNLASACSTVRAASRTSAYIFNARAVCLALEGEIERAELALEFARDEASQDIWFTSVIGNMAAESKAKTKPKYDSGLTLALSVGAELPLPENGFTGIHPQLAALLIQRTDIPRALRIQTADAAAFSGALSVDAYREAYRTVPVRIRALVPTITGETVVIPEVEDDPDAVNPNAFVNPLDEALQASADPTIELEEKARLYNRALMLARGDLTRFQMTSALLLPHINDMRDASLPPQMAETFAVATIVAGDPGRAGQFIMRAARPDGQEPDAYMLAWLEGIQIISGEIRASQASIDVSRRLANSASEGQRARAMRMIHGFVMLGAPISLEARAFLAQASEETLMAGNELPPGDMLLTDAALHSNALGEGVMRAVLLMGRDPAAMNMFDLARIVTALSDAGLEDMARQLALEGIRYHKPKD